MAYSCRSVVRVRSQTVSQSVDKSTNIAAADRFLRCLFAVVGAVAMGLRQYQQPHFLRCLNPNSRLVYSALPHASVAGCLLPQFSVPFLCA